MPHGNNHAHLTAAKLFTDSNSGNMCIINGNLGSSMQVWNILSLGRGMSNIRSGSTMATGLINGGPASLVYGAIIAFIGSLCSAMSLAELASM